MLTAFPLSVPFSPANFAALEAFARDMGPDAQPDNPAALICCDWLGEREVKLADLLLLYAGSREGPERPATSTLEVTRRDGRPLETNEAAYLKAMLETATQIPAAAWVIDPAQYDFRPVQPPDLSFTDGLPQPVLAEWLRRAGDRRAEEVQRVMVRQAVGPANGNSLIAPGTWSVIHQSQARNRPDSDEDLLEWDFNFTLCPNRPAAVRACKRLVLRLFDEFAYEKTFRVSREDFENLIADGPTRYQEWSWWGQRWQAIDIGELERLGYRELPALLCQRGFRLRDIAHHYDGRNRLVEFRQLTDPGSLIPPEPRR